MTLKYAIWQEKEYRLINSYKRKEVFLKTAPIIRDPCHYQETWFFALEKYTLGTRCSVPNTSCIEASVLRKYDVIWEERA